MTIRELLAQSEANARSTASIADPDGVDALRDAVAALTDVIDELLGALE